MKVMSKEESLLVQLFEFSPSSPERMNADSLRRYAEFLYRNQSYETCRFIACKLVTLSEKSPQDCALLARTYLALGEPMNALQVLSKFQDAIADSPLDLLLLCAQAWFKASRPDEVIKLTENVATKWSEQSPGLQKDPESMRLMSLVFLERGKSFEILDNTKKALFAYKSALLCDVRCFEALDRLSSAQITSLDEKELISSLRASGAFSIDTIWMEPILECILSKHDCTEQSDAKFERLQSFKFNQALPSLGDDTFLLAAKAEARMQQRDARGALEISSRISTDDPSNFKLVAATHIAALVELGMTSALFQLGHSQVKLYPKSALSWYAVGAYYYSSRNFDAAKRYFAKATSLNQNLIPAWMGMAHAHSLHDESDRAMAVYRTATRLFPGSHMPVLGTALEYLRTNNLSLAEQFCLQAASLCQADPAVYNELGVIHYKRRRYGEAIEAFLQAIQKCRGISEKVFSLAFEHLYFNLGHCYRRAGDFTRAIDAYTAGLRLAPRNASGHAALGLTHHLKGEFEKALDEYHISLGLRPDDATVEELMEFAARELVSLHV